MKIKNDNPPHLKIAMVAACPFPANHGTPGGIREMAHALSDRGHEVHIVTYHFGEGTIPRGVKIHRIPGWGFKRKVVVGPTKEKPLLNLSMVFTLCRVIYREKIDIIHAHNYEGALIGYAGRLLTRKPLVYNAINTMIDELPSYNFFKPKVLAVWLAKFLDFIVPRLADQNIAISEELVQFLKDRGVKPERIRYIPLGVDTKPFDEVEKADCRVRYRPEDFPLVVYTGTIDRFQRMDYLLKAMGVVCKTIPDAKLLLAANIAAEKDFLECEQLIERLGLQGNVKFLRDCTFEEVPCILSAADVTVISRPDCPGFPVKLLNYMSAGKPIVLFEGTSKDLQHLRHAFLVKDHDWEGMGKGIISVLQDPVLSETLGKNARLWVDEHLSWGTLSEKIERVYEKSLSKKRQA